MMAVSVDEGDEMPFVVHVEPRIHVEVEAERSLDAQLTAFRRVADELELTELEVHELALEDMSVDTQGMMMDQMGDDGASGLDEMLPDDDSELPDLDDPENTVLSMDDLLESDGDSDSDSQPATQTDELLDESDADDADGTVDE